MLNIKYISLSTCAYWILHGGLSHAIKLQDIYGKKLVLDRKLTHLVFSTTNKLANYTRYKLASKKVHWEKVYTLTSISETPATLFEIPYNQVSMYMADLYNENKVYSNTIAYLHGIPNNVCKMQMNE